MRALLENPLWPKAGVERNYQRLFGAISGVLLAIALICLFDGLLAHMRQGSNDFRLLPGQAITVSGPAVLKNPVNSDLVARFSPENCPLRFDLEGFYTGYWFGNGMWRGHILANEASDPADCALRISFKGAPAQTIQAYKIRIFANEEALRAASLSMVDRFFGLNPFIIAAWCGIFGVICGLVTYYFGRGYGNILRELGLAEIYAQDPRAATIWCLAPRDLAPKPGLARMVLDKDGHAIAEARSVAWKKGKLQLQLMDDKEIPSGALVCLRHPEERHAFKAGNI